MAWTTKLFNRGFHTRCLCESLIDTVHIPNQIVSIADQNFRFSFFMLCGLLITIRWVPGVEYGYEGKIKSLEEWAVGRVDTERK